MARAAIRKGAGVLVVTALAVTGSLVVRHSLAAAATRQEWQSATTERLHNFGSTRTLEILPLIDEVAGREGLQSEHGVAYLISTDDQTILMDVG